MVSAPGENNLFQVKEIIRVGGGRLPFVIFRQRNAFPFRTELTIKVSESAGMLLAAAPGIRPVGGLLIA